MPLYLVKHPGADEARERLVEAPNKASARNFAARDLIQVELASTTDCFRAAKAGTEIEVAAGIEPDVSPEAPQANGDQTTED